MLQGELEDEDFDMYKEEDYLDQQRNSNKNASILSRHIEFDEELLESNFEKRLYRKKKSPSRVENSPESVEGPK
jgi:hypothetical protein